MQVFLESLKVVPEWLVKQIYLYSNTALVVLSAFVLLVASLTVFQCRRAWTVSYTHLTLPTNREV